MTKSVDDGGLATLHAPGNDLSHFNVGIAFDDNTQVRGRNIDSSTFQKPRKQMSSGDTDRYNHRGDKSKNYVGRVTFEKIFLIGLAPVGYWFPEAEQRVGDVAAGGKDVLAGQHKVGL